jgi:PAS domain S-box-containing protein
VLSRIPVIIKVLSGFAFAVLGIGYFLYSTYNNTNETVRENVTLNYHMRLITSVQRLLSDMEKIQNGNRGYLLMHKEIFLAPYYSGLTRYKNDLADLEKLTKLDERKKLLVDSLKYYSETETKLAEEMLMLCKDRRFKEAEKLFANGEENRLMVSLTAVAGKLENQSRQDLNTASAVKGFTSSETRNNFLALSAIILIALVCFYFVIVGDLKESEKVKEELKLASIRIQDLFDNAPTGYITVDGKLFIKRANKTVAKWLGLQVSDVEKKNLKEFINEHYNEVLNQLIEKDSVTNLEVEINGKNGILEILLDSVTIIDDPNEVERRINLTDITKRKKTEEENRYLARVIDQTSDAIVSNDIDLKIRSWNKGAEKMYGFTAEEVINKDVSILRSNLTTEERKSVAAEILDKGIWIGELMHKRKDGTQIDILSSSSLLRDENEVVTGIVSVIQDITHRKMYERKLTNFNNELIEKVNIKTKEIVNILERVTDGFLSLDKDYKVTFLNNIAASMLGIEKSNILGKDMRSSFSKEDNPFRQAYIKSFTTQTRVEIEDYYPYLNKWFYCVSYPSPEGLSIFFRDITKRKESEVKLVESEKQYRHLFENNPLPMWVLDVESMSILDVNLAAIKLYGFSYLEFLSKKMTDLVSPEDSHRFKEFCRRRIKNSENAGIWKHHTNDKREIQVEILCYDTKYTERPSMLIISNDITEKLRYEQELTESRDQLRQLSIHSEKVREEERAHIAREIHDELGQQLTGLKMDLSWLSKRIDTSAPETREKLTEMLGLVDDTVKSIRKIASELRPGMLDDLGLNAAIDWQTHEFEKRSGITCIYNSNLRERKFDKNISIGVFRILQEALTNVARHSKATKVSCNLLANDNIIHLTVNDNGIGIQDKDGKLKTLGLLGMRERALMMNGKLTIENKPEGGTEVDLIVPLTAELN